MKKMNVLHLYIGVLVLFFMVSCSKDDTIETETIELEQTTTVDAKAAFTYELKTDEIVVKEETELSLVFGSLRDFKVFTGESRDPNFESLRIVNDPVAPWAEGFQTQSNKKSFTLRIARYSGSNLPRKITLIAQYLGASSELLHSKLIHITQLPPPQFSVSPDCPTIEAGSGGLVPGHRVLITSIGYTWTSKIIFKRNVSPWAFTNDEVHSKFGSLRVLINPWRNCAREGARSARLEVRGVNNNNPNDVQIRSIPITQSCDTGGPGHN
ncbi:hypothetical protein [Aquimarina sp. AU58]|uniref:hypothetical protein n=1 Tax=Aquimarina sp. AU58 TaxID=1874112 RepID=UPI000D6E437F|nr:hypothetical protein [Aquimarina sp. AU58]